MNVGGKISVARHVSREMTLISREREMCSGNSKREDGKTAMKGKGGMLEKGTGDYQIGFPKLS